MNSRSKAWQEDAAKSSWSPQRAKSAFEPRPFAAQLQQADSPSAKPADLLDAYLDSKKRHAAAQRRSSQTDVPQDLPPNGAALRQLREGGEPNRTGMPDRLKSGLEQVSGMDLSSVRVHYDSPKPSQINALAYTQGRDIHVGPGQEQHLAHEGWHAVQQMEGRVRPTTEVGGVAINDDGGLEREADVMGTKALQTRRQPLDRP